MSAENDLARALPLLVEPVQYPPILTVERAADLLGVEADAVRKKIRDGSIKAGTLGPGRYYLVLEDLIAQIRASYASGVR